MSHFSGQRVVICLLSGSQWAVLTLKFHSGLSEDWDRKVLDLQSRRATSRGSGNVREGRKKAGLGAVKQESSEFL